MPIATTFPFEVDATTDVPLWVQLRQRLIYLINSGYFKPGDQLPTVRGLASDISINYNTVNKAYLSLVTDGYLESTRGRGVFVRDLDAEMDADYAQEVDVLMDDCVAACRDLGMSLDDVQKCMELKIRQIKKAEGKEAAGELDGSGRIVKVDVGAKTKRTQAGA
ncbi:MAG: GntR family transcriptional regulator [Gordonibacter sp.]|uniref:GntR family transcriptional regulator n=1 Tax=Gordonibacter sp. TaxID=1968902 RepID=UPI002FC81D77